MHSEDAFGREEAQQDFAKGETWISPQDAAAQLGISVRAVQIRAQRGTLQSKRVDRKLYVCLTHIDEEKTRNAGETFRETAQPNETLDETSVQALLAHQAEEIAFLRGRIQEHEEERRRRDTADGEMRRLMLADKTELQALRQKVTLLLGPMETTEAASVEVPEEQERGDIVEAKAAPVPAIGRAWWAFWKRRD